MIGKVVILKLMVKQLMKWENKTPTYDNLLQIKGVGDYITNAILIHVQGKRCHILDLNIIRIYERAFGVSSNRPRPRSDKELWLKTLQLMPKKNISQYVYAILDLEALVCRAKNPRCLECPNFKDIRSGFDKEIL